MKCETLNKSVAGVITALSSFGLLGLLSWLLFTAYAHAQDITVIKTSAKLSEWRLDQIDQNRRDIEEIKATIKGMDERVHNLEVQVHKLDEKVSQNQSAIMELDRKVGLLTEGQVTILNILRDLQKSNQVAAHQEL